MSSEWDRLTIGDLVRRGEATVQTGPFGSQLHSHDYVAAGVAVVPTEAIGRGRILDIAVPQVDAVKAAQLERHRLRRGDILFARRGAQATGLSAMVDDRFDGALCGTGALLLRLDSPRVAPSYLAMFMSSEATYVWLRMHAVGAVMPNLNTDIIKALPITLPPIGEQQSLAKFFGEIDDRIALLREANATLEAIAQALFTSWFVDFDPVRAKSQGLAPPGMDEATAAVFPDAFEAAADGAVPIGWIAGKVGDFAHLQRGSVNPGAEPDAEFEHFSLPAFDDAKEPVRELGEAIKSNKSPVPAGSVLLSKLNPHIPRVWLPVNPGPRAICSTEFLVFSSTAAASTEFLYCCFAAPEFSSRLSQLVTGTSNSHQRVKPDSVLRLPAVLPPASALAAFTHIVRPILGRVGHNRRQAQSLASLRDTLLPRFISGQLRLPEAITEVEAA